MSAIITLRSKDDETFEVPLDSMKLSKLIATMVDDDSDTMEIPLPNVSSVNLKRIIEFCEYFKENPLDEIQRPLKNNDLSKVVPAWYAKFIDITQEELFELILATNYMDIKDLLDLACAKVASMIKGRKPEEIRKLFNIKDE
jgi:S-phase kinase-associated protein 1